MPWSLSGLFGLAVAGSHQGRKGQLEAPALTLEITRSRQTPESNAGCWSRPLFRPAFLLADS